MEWEKASCSTDIAHAMANEEMRRRLGDGDRRHEGGFAVRMMSDEQIQELRKQIAIYAVLTEQLVEIYYSAVSWREPAAAGSSLRSLYNPLLGPGGSKLIGRQRWSPLPMQLEILENIFSQGHGSPSKQKIKEITAEVAIHGQVSEMNVYNWFQNRRARLKRKQAAAFQKDSTGSKVEEDGNSLAKLKTSPNKDYHEDILLMIENHSNSSTQ